MKLTLLSLLLATASANAQQAVTKPVACSKIDSVYEQLEKFGEKPIWTSPSPAEKSYYLFFVNSESGTWSLIQVPEGDNIGCLVAFGETKKRVPL